MQNTSIQSNTKPHTQNQDLHDQAVKLLVEIDGSKKKSIDYNKRRRAATAALRPVLTKIWAAFDRGETVGGCAGVKEWCKKIGTITYRRCRQIITGESQAKKVKSLHFLKELIDLISRNAGDAIDKRASEIANLIHYEPPAWKTQREAEEQAEREA
ncbi:MAG TPA: hypothetical protein VIX37_17235, partial [Candidatus Sulfotelmatobacter sp.]